MNHSHETQHQLSAKISLITFKSSSDFREHIYIVIKYLLCDNKIIEIRYVHRLFIIIQFLLTKCLKKEEIFYWLFQENEKREKKRNLTIYILFVLCAFFSLCVYLVNTTVFNVTRLIQIDKHIFLLCVLLGKTKRRKESFCFRVYFV